MHGHKDVVQLLLDSKAQPDIANQNGITPLKSAAWNGNKAVVQLLLSGEAEKNGTTELHEASLNGNRLGTTLPKWRSWNEHTRSKWTNSTTLCSMERSQGCGPAPLGWRGWAEHSNSHWRDFATFCYTWKAQRCGAVVEWLSNGNSNKSPSVAHQNYQCSREIRSNARQTYYLFSKCEKICPPVWTPSFLSLKWGRPIDRSIVRSLEPWWWSTLSWVTGNGKKNIRRKKSRPTYL